MPTELSESQTNGPIIPAVFKEYLFWPNQAGPKSTRTKKAKAHVPSVATSDAWLEYDENKKREMLRKQQDMDGRKTQRLVAAEAKKQKPVKKSTWKKMKCLLMLTAVSCRLVNCD